jgi:hypothetical protein
MSNHQNKLGKREQVVRADGNTNVYQFMADPTLSQEELDACRRIDYTPARWVLVEVIPAAKVVK